MEGWVVGGDVVLLGNLWTMTGSPHESPVPPRGSVSSAEGTISFAGPGQRPVLVDNLWMKSERRSATVRAALWSSTKHRRGLGLPRLVTSYGGGHEEG